MTTSVNQKLLDNAVGHAIDLTRYSNSVVRDILSVLNEADKELVAKIQARQIDNWTTKRLNVVLADVRSIVAKSYTDAAGLMTRDMTDFSRQEINLVAKSLFDQLKPLAFNERRKAFLTDISEAIKYAKELKLIEDGYELNFIGSFNSLKETPSDIDIFAFTKKAEHFQTDWRSSEWDKFHAKYPDIDITVRDESNIDIFNDAIKMSKEKYGNDPVKFILGEKSAPSTPLEFGVNLSITSPTAEQLAAIVATEPILVGEGQVALLEEIFQGLAANKEKTIRQAIRLGMIEGESIPDLVRRLIGTKAARFTDGIIEKDRRGAEAMVRTIVNSTSNKAADATYKANQDIIKGQQWHSTLDGRTTPICMARDGKVFPVDSGPRPPAHINCRSFMVPLMKSWRELGVDLDEMDEGSRASMDGQVPESTTYGTWLKGKDEAFQQKVLGVERAKLFAEGKYDIKDFVNAKGEYKKLSEL